MVRCIYRADAAYRRTGEQRYGTVGNISVILFCYGWMVRRAAVGCDLDWGDERGGMHLFQQIIAIQQPEICEALSERESGGVMSP